MECQMERFFTYRQLREYALPWPACLVAAACHSGGVQHMWLARSVGEIGDLAAPFTLHVLTPICCSDTTTHCTFFYQNHPFAKMDSTYAFSVTALFALQRQYYCVLSNLLIYFYFVIVFSWHAARRPQRPCNRSTHRQGRPACKCLVLGRRQVVIARSSLPCLPCLRVESINISTAGGTAKPGKRQPDYLNEFILIII